MYNYPPAMQNAPLSSYMGGGAPQPTQASRPSTMHGSVPFRAGDWKCGAEGCGYHNFAKNVSCLRCGASRVQAALFEYPSINVKYGLDILDAFSSYLGFSWLFCF